MTEKETFLNTWDREFQTTIKVLKAYPPDKLDLKPHERSRSARELAWTFVVEEKVIAAIIAGKIDFQNLPPAPATLREILTAYENAHKEMARKVKGLRADAFNKTIPFPVGPKQMGDVRRGDVFWTMLLDGVHHRGQFSVYLRMAGGKVPSIYGPSADEPWM